MISTNNAAPSGTTAAIRAVDLRKTYREGWIKRKKFQALNGVSFEVQAGRVFGLLGPNGAGKTTFVKVLMGIIRHTSGSATVFGLPAGSLAARRMIGYLPEKLALPSYLTGYQALEYCGGLSGLSGGQVRAKRDELLSLVGLEGWGKSSIKKYSKGMVQRLGLAQAMIHQPKLLVLDEPTDGLDPKARAGVREILLRLSKGGTTVFLNSHLLQEVEVLCQDVAILSEGNVTYCGAVAGIHDFLQTSRGKTNGISVKFLVAGPPESITALTRIGPDSAEWDPRGFRASAIKLDGEGQWWITEELEDQKQVDARVDLLRKAGLSILSLTPQRLSLEAAFLELVGHSEKSADVKNAEVRQVLLQAGRRQ
ncbi:MAG: ABC transporter ATP-binding protein [Planctomycetaceae bacterium]|nr:ABC transporter ATP-binding protein [Planctomycetaceae bacterium]